VEEERQNHSELVGAESVLMTLEAEAVERLAWERVKEPETIVTNA
jgi:hypothetical protein